MASKNSSWLGALVLLVAVGACSDSSRAPDEAGRIGAVSAALTSCDSLPEWTVKSYSGGDRVKHGGSVYECRAWPYSGWCGEVGYEPGVTIHWQNAWLLIDTCSSGTGGPAGLAAGLAVAVSAQEAQVVARRGRAAPGAPREGQRRRLRFNRPSTTPIASMARAASSRGRSLSPLASTPTTTRRPPRAGRARRE